jgi:hypothetical protein
LLEERVPHRLRNSNYVFIELARHFLNKSLTNRSRSTNHVCGECATTGFRQKSFKNRGSVQDSIILQKRFEMGGLFNRPAPWKEFVCVDGFATAKGVKMLAQQPLIAQVVRVLEVVDILIRFHCTKPDFRVAPPLKVNAWDIVPFALLPTTLNQVAADIRELLLNNFAFRVSIKIILNALF